MPFRGQGGSGSGGSGTVTSVGVAADSGTGSSITSAGTITINGSGGISTSVTGTTVTVAGSGSSNFTTTSISVSDTPYSVASSDQQIFADLSGGSITVNLPSVAVAGRVITIIDTGSASVSNALTVSGNGNNVSGTSSYTIDGAFQAISVTSNGSDYFIF